MLPVFQTGIFRPLRGSGRACARARSAIVFLAVFVALCPAVARATGGSGDADSATTSNPVVAGAYGSWTINYRATEDFDHPAGGVVELRIPAGWTPPQTTNPTAFGYVTFSNAQYIDSIVTVGQRIRLRVGKPGNKFSAGNQIGIHYGLGGPPQSARASTSAPGNATFLVLSQPFTGTDQLLALTSGSPVIEVVPDTVVSVKIVDAAGVEVGPLSRTTDQDTTHLYLRGYDQFGNSARWVNGAWSVSGGIGAPAPASGVGTVLTLGTVGAGKAYADSGAWSDSTGVITVTNGAYASLAFTSPGTATAGTSFAATVESRDADGNRVTGGGGSAAPVRIVAYADSLGSTAADPSFTNPNLSLAAGFWSGTLTAQRSGTFFLAARDTLSGITSSPRRRLVVAAATPDHISAIPDTLRLVAGVPDTVTVIARDFFGNRSALPADEELTLWTDRSQGRFETMAGAQVFTLTIPAGVDSARVRFVDTQTTASAGRIRAIDANGSAPFVGTAEAPVFTAPSVPAGAIALAAAPGTLVADGVDASQVTSLAVRDVFSNPVAEGERFTVTGAGLTVVTDDDLGTPGFQWTAASGGTLSGQVRAGTTVGPASVNVVSERGSASGSVAVALVPGPPAGTIALASVPDSVAADSVATRSISAAGLVDGFSNAVADGEAYTVATTLGSIVTPDADGGTAGIQVLAAGGAIALDLLGGSTLGTATVSAVSVRGSASGSVEVRIVPGAVSADSSTVVAVSPIAVGPPGSTVTITLRDRMGHPLAGVPSDSIVVGTSGVSTTRTALAPATDAVGAIAWSVTATSAGAASVSVTARGVSLAATPGIQFVPGPLDTLVVTGPVGPLTAGVPDSVVITARDPFGNAMPGRTDVVHASAASGAALGLPATVSLSGGSAVVTFTPTAAVPLAIQVTDDSSHATSHGPVAVRSGAPYQLAADPPATDTLQAGGSIPIRALVVDAYGNAADGDTVIATIVEGGGGVAPGTDGTDASGAADFTLQAGSTPGTVTLRLEALGSAAPDPVRSDSISVVVIPSSSASVEIAAGDSVTAGGFLDFTLTLRDAFGNVAAGATPTLTLDTSASLPDSVSWSLGAGATGTLLDNGPSDDLATYTFAVSDAGAAALRARLTRAETLRVTVSGVGSPVQSGNIVVIPAAATALAVVSGQGQTAVVDRDLPLPLRVSARDAFQNLAPGATVTFGAVAGGGFVDVVPGNPVQTDATTDASGVATCQVAHLGTVAGSSNNRFRAALPASGDSVFFDATATPDQAVSIALAPGSLGLTRGDSAAVTATVRDQFGNAAPGASITFYLGSPPAGSLATLGSTSGTGTTQVGDTDAAGQVAVLYRAPGTAPASDVIFARGTVIAPVSIDATVSPSGIDRLVVLPDASTWTAGVASRVVVRALDAGGNLATGDSATIVLGATDAAAFSPAFGPLSGGEFITFATATAADTLRVTAASAAGTVAAASGVVTVTPAPPAGTIPIVAGRTELTADGRSSTTVTMGPLQDPYGNLSPVGTLITVTADSVFAADASPAPGLQIPTGTDNLARAVLVAPAAAGPDTVDAATVLGTATGSLAVLYLPPPSLARSGSVAPSIVAPGQSYAFAVDVTNTASTGPVLVGTSSAFSFGAGPGAFVSSPSAAVTIPAGATRTLAMPATAVSTALAPGTYAPALRLIGTDATGDPFDFYLSLAGDQVHVAGIGVVAVSASPDPVPLGHPALQLTFRVDNLTAAAATIDAVALAPATFTVNGTAPGLPAVLPALGSTTITLTVAVPASGIPSGTVVSSGLAASAAFGAVSVSAATQSPLDFQVVSGATLVAQATGTSPARYLRARTFAPAARVANTGSAAVTLSAGATQLVLQRGATRLSSQLTAAAALAGGGAANLAFDSLAVPAATPLGRYAASLVLAGTEAGQAFADTIPLAPDSVDVLDPALLAVQGSVAPDTVSAGQTRMLQLTVGNTGDVAFALDGTTRLSLGPPVSATLVPTTTAAVPAHGSVVVAFAAQPIGSAPAPGTAAATLEARGTEDGRPRVESLGAGLLEAMPPASIVHVQGSTFPDTVRAGQTIDVACSVRNAGGSPFTVDPAQTRLVITDGVESAGSSASGAPFTLAPGGTAALSFPGVAFPAALASQSYPVQLTVVGAEWGQAESTVVASLAGEISVVEPVAAVQVRGVGAGAPIQVAAEGVALAFWTLELQPLIPPGGSSSAHVHSVALTVLVEGVPAGAPSAALTGLALRDSQGALLAQAAPGAANPVVLALTAPLALTGPAESLFVEVTLRPGTASRSVALRVAAAADLTIRDDLTQGPVSITAAGGLPFQPLTSGAVTIFAKAHGYPNPFRLGREDVRLSYQLGANASVRVAIYTLLGDLVREISLPAGAPGGTRGLNEVPWDGRNGKGETVRPGVYVAQIEGGGVSERIKVGVLR